MYDAFIELVYVDSIKFLLIFVKLMKLQQADGHCVFGDEV